MAHRTLVDQAVTEFMGSCWAERQAEKHREKLGGLVVHLTDAEVAEYVRRTSFSEEVPA